ncbi:helix-turn-helix transcriptional regulator [Methylibium petroleiphilum]
MDEFPVRTADQLHGLLQSFRKAAGLTQADLAARLGVTQQTLSALERNAGTVSAARLMKLLSILDVELVLRQRGPSGAASPKAGGVPGGSDKAQW